jgi:hypothetical protein
LRTTPNLYVPLSSASSPLFAATGYRPRVDVIGILLVVVLVLAPTVRAVRRPPWALFARLVSGAIGIAALGVAGLMVTAVTDPGQDSPDALYLAMSGITTLLALALIVTAWRGPAHHPHT